VVLYCALFVCLCVHGLRACEYACVHVRACMRAHACVRTCVRAWMRAWMRACMHACTLVCSCAMHECVHACKHACGSENSRSNCFVPASTCVTMQSCRLRARKLPQATATAEQPQRMFRFHPTFLWCGQSAMHGTLLIRET